MEQKGLVIMDTPGNDASSMAGMAAGCAQVCVFSSGHGTPIGCPLMPVIKITGNRETARLMEDNIDFDASPALTGEKTIDQLAGDLHALLVDTASGRETKAELLGYTETAVMRACNYV